MTLHVSVLGIDGSGKSSVTAALPAVLSAELGVRAGAAGEKFLITDPDEDQLAPGFHPEGLPLAARGSKRLKQLAKRVVNNRRLYPAAKLAQMLFQDLAARKLGNRYRAEVVISDGNTLLSAAGRAANYLRPASDRGAKADAGTGPDDLRAVFDYILEGKPISPDRQERLPPLGKARGLNRLLQWLGLGGVWLPDIVVFLDLAPQMALARIAGRGAAVDRHENEKDLAQARQMYLRTLEGFAGHRGSDKVIPIDVNGLSPGETLAAIVERLRPLISARPQQAASAAAPLGTTTTKLSGASVWARVFNYRYLVRYLAAHWPGDAWREPLFPFSSPGRLFLKEGYSAGVMRVIYDQDEKRYGWFARAFLDYPLHRAVYDRLQILTRLLEPELENRLREKPDLRIFTAPSGFADDLFRPLEAIAARNPEATRRLQLVAADLDPGGNLQDELAARAKKIRMGFEFLRGDLASDRMRARFAAQAPFDLALFVGLSGWIGKPKLFRHLRWVREHLRRDGLLVTDCFVAGPYGLPGRYVGYRVSYYEPEQYRAVLDFCGFDGGAAAVHSGRDQINHVLVFRPRLPPQAGRPERG